MGMTHGFTVRNVHGESCRDENSRGAWVCRGDRFVDEEQPYGDGSADCDER
jgi:hypothetical protein